MHKSTVNNLGITCGQGCVFFKSFAKVIYSKCCGFILSMEKALGFTKNIHDFSITFPHKLGYVSSPLSSLNTDSFHNNLQLQLFINNIIVS